MPTPWRRSIVSEVSIHGANSATNSEAGEIRTAVRPDGTSSSPSVISVNGSATASVPSSSAERGRERSSLPTWRTEPEPIVVRIRTSSTTAAIATRLQTIIGAERSSSAYLISRYEPPQIADRRPSSPIWRGDIGPVCH